MLANGKRKDCVQKKPVVHSFSEPLNGDNSER